jgi:ribonuclease T1
MLRYYFLIFIWLGVGWSMIQCQSNTRPPSTQVPEQQAPQLSEENHFSGPVIPQKVYTVLEYIRKNDSAPKGYVGGRKFGNYEQHLPRSTTRGHPITYREWDVTPLFAGKNRGAERLVTGSDGRAWYTRNHYNSFIEVPPR